MTKNKILKSFEGNGAKIELTHFKGLVEDVYEIRAEQRGVRHSSYVDTNYELVSETFDQLVHKVQSGENL